MAVVRAAHLVAQRVPPLAVRRAGSMAEPMAVSTAAWLAVPWA